MLGPDHVVEHHDVRVAELLDGRHPRRDRRAVVADLARREDRTHLQAHDPSDPHLAPGAASKVLDEAPALPLGTWAWSYPLVVGEQRNDSPVRANALRFGPRVCAVNTSTTTRRARTASATRSIFGGFTSESEALEQGNRL